MKNFFVESYVNVRFIICFEMFKNQLLKYIGKHEKSLFYHPFINLFIRVKKIFFSAPKRIFKFPNSPE